MVGVSCNNNRNTHACIHIPPKKTHPRGHGPTLLASCCEASQRLKASVSCAIKKARSSSVCCGSRSRTGAEKPGLWGVGWLGGGLLVGGRGLRGVIMRVFGCVLYYSIICTSTLPPTDQPTTHREEKTHRGGWRERARSRRCRSKRSAPPASAPAPTKRVGGWLICFGRRYGLGGTVSGSPYVRVHP